LVNGPGKLSLDAFLRKVRHTSPAQQALHRPAGSLEAPAI
jgi:hypothetical protein